jgi:hypothetical protein
LREGDDRWEGSRKWFNETPVNVEGGELRSWPARDPRFGVMTGNDALTTGLG